MDMTNKHYLLVVVVRCVRALSSLFLLKTLMRLWHNVIVTSTFHLIYFVMPYNFTYLPISHFKVQVKLGFSFYFVCPMSMYMHLFEKLTKYLCDIWIYCICL